MSTRSEERTLIERTGTIGVVDVPDAEGGIDTEEDLARANARWAMHEAAATVPNGHLTLSQEYT